MSLTDEQRKVRATGIGASETPAILELSPNKNPMDVWLAKTGRTAESDAETEAQWLGTLLEQPLRDLYKARTGRVSDPVGHTYRHPQYPHVLASPDGFVASSGESVTWQPCGGTELKAVSSNMAHHWDEATVPDYVEVQARQCMAVLDREWWDVVALIDSTTFLVQRIHRDREVEEQLCEAVEAFWETHVVGDTPPSALTPEEHRAALRARFPYRAKEKEPRRVPPEDGEHVEQAARWLMAITAERKRLEALEEQLTNSFCEYVGNDYGVKDGWGQFLWYPVGGRVDWKRVAEELAGGALPAELVEKYRGAPTRIPRVYPFKAKGKRR